MPFPCFLALAPLVSSVGVSRPAISQRKRSHQVPTSCQPSHPQNSDSSDDKPPQISANWREFRAGLVAGSAAQHEKDKENAYRTGHWAHHLSLPETGCFLASHPAYYRRQALYLTQSVVFITHYDPSLGATGLVLNRPLTGSAEELESAGMFGRSVNLSATNFAQQPVYIGGVHLNKGILTVIHSDSEIGGQQPLDGVYVCDFGHFISKAGNSDYSKARLFCGCLRWPPGALESEVDDGSWYCIAASELFALKHCIRLPKPLWLEIMQNQGEPFAMIANKVYERKKNVDSDEEL